MTVMIVLFTLEAHDCPAICCTVPRIVSPAVASAYTGVSVSVEAETGIYSRCFSLLLIQFPFFVSLWRTFFFYRTVRKKPSRRAPMSFINPPTSYAGRRIAVEDFFAKHLTKDKNSAASLLTKVSKEALVVRKCHCDTKLQGVRCVLSSASSEHWRIQLRHLLRKSSCFPEIREKTILETESSLLKRQLLPFVLSVAERSIVS